MSGGAQHRAGAWLKCPQCLNDRFYVMEAGGGHTYFQVDAAGRLFTTRHPRKELSGLDTSDIHCTACGWRGALKKLVP